MHQLLCKEKRSYAFTEHCCENRTSAHIYKRENNRHQPNQSRVTRSFSLARCTHHKLKITLNSFWPAVSGNYYNKHTHIHSHQKIFNGNMEIKQNKKNKTGWSKADKKKTTSMINQQYDKLASI